MAVEVAARLDHAGFGAGDAGGEALVEACLRFGRFGRVSCTRAGPAPRVGPVVRAHDADVVYAHLTLVGQGAPLLETVTLTADTLRLLAPIDVDGDQLVTQEELTARSEALRLGVWGDAPLSAGGTPCTLGPE